MSVKTKNTFDKSDYKAKVKLNFLKLVSGMLMKKSMQLIRGGLKNNFLNQSKKKNQSLGRENQRKIFDLVDQP